MDDEHIPDSPGKGTIDLWLNMIHNHDTHCITKQTYALNIAIKSHTMSMLASCVRAKFNTKMEGGRGRGVLKSKLVRVFRTFHAKPGESCFLCECSKAFGTIASTLLNVNDEGIGNSDDCDQQNH